MSPQWLQKTATTSTPSPGTSDPVGCSACSRNMFWLTTHLS